MDLGKKTQDPENKQDFGQVDPPPNGELISLAEAASLTPYSQEYISLLARKGKILAWKKGRNWYTTKRVILDYVARQAKETESELQKKAAYTTEVLSPQSPQPSTTEIIKALANAVDAKLEGFKSQFEPILHEVTAKVSQVAAQTLLKPPPPQEVKVRKPRHSPLFYIIILLVALPLIFFGLSKGLADDLPAKLLSIIKNAWTLDGHKPGTEANEVLILNEAGNISIKGHIETEGQLRSYARDGVAPIIVDSVTKIENLNVQNVLDIWILNFGFACNLWFVICGFPYSTVVSRRDKIGAVFKRSVVKPAKLDETVAHHIRIRSFSRFVLANHIINYCSFVLFGKVEFPKWNLELGANAHSVKPVVGRLAGFKQGTTFFPIQGRTLFERRLPHLDKDSRYIASCLL